MVRFAVAESRHVLDFSSRLRDDDVREVRALGMSPEQGLLDSLHRSSAAFTAFVGERAAAMFGVAPRDGLLGDTGVVWMLGTDLVPQHKRVVLATSRAFVANCLRLFSSLECYVDMRYNASVRWVQWLGFSRESVVPVRDTEFGVFVRRAS